MLPCASGGLWKTNNNGHTFEPLFDDRANIIMGAIAVDPNKPETVWAGTDDGAGSAEVKIVNLVLVL